MRPLPLSKLYMTLRQSYESSRDSGSANGQSVRGLFVLIAVKTRVNAVSQVEEDRLLTVLL